MKITISNSLLDMVNMDGITTIPPFNQPYFKLPSGIEPYRLLIHLSYCFDNIIIADIGTNRGASALALAQNRKNRVFSVDVVDVKENDMGMKNIEFYLGDFHIDINIQNKILESTFILLDIDHEYINEIWLYNFLIENKWNGCMICDDIHYNDPMKKFWSEVSNPKIDLTKYGHGSGTGCILFGTSPVELDLT